jgi:hypothetical protein
LRTSHPRKVLQSAIELGELVHRFVPNQRFADEDNLIGIVDRDELDKSANVSRFALLHRLPDRQPSP